MGIPGRIADFPLKGILLFLVFSFALLLCPGLPCPAGAQERTIIVDEKNPPKARKTRPSGNTKVVIIKGKSDEDEPPPAADGDICSSLGGYYCKQVGREAWLGEGGMYLGRITGVAWREKGQPVGLYLGTPVKDSPIEEALSKNALSKSGTFYFIIVVEGLEAPVLVEPHRIDTGE